MSIIYEQFKVYGDTYIKHLTKYEHEWKPNEEIDSREKGEEYNRKMELLSKEINCSRDRLETEYRLHSIYHLERQSEALDSIAESLKALLALKVSE
jgi:hypothetical protein